MGKRRVERGARRADEREAVGAAQPTVVGRGNVADHVLNLQREYGNSAVTTMVQRAPKSRAASTDAPGSKKGKDKGKKGPAQVNYAPTSLHYNGTLDQQRSAADDYWHGKNGKSMDLEKAAKYMEDVWLLTEGDGPARAVALNVSRIWKEWSEPKRADFWMKVHTGEIKPKVEDLSDKHF
jgi:hypothetical protein